MNSLIGFRDVVKKIFGARLKKVIRFGKNDVLLLFSSLSKADHDEVFRLAEEWSINESPVSPLTMDEKTYKKLVAEGKQLAKDIQKTGVVL